MISHITVAKIFKLSFIKTQDIFQVGNPYIDLP